jgi:mRNA-degrading endonuclease toxin of MazEF toxin-antitoxin module
MMDSNSVFGGEGIPYVFEKFELLGPFEKLDSIPWEASKGLKPRSRKEVVKQYEIRWTVLDPSRGAEMAKTRPVVIVSLDELNGRPAEVAVDQIRTVSKARLGPRIGSLSDDEA